MKDKNRFSILLEHLMATAELKIVFSQKLFSMMTPISVNGSAENCCQLKNHENTLQAISHCIVEALSEESTTQLLQEYQLQDIKILKLLFMTISNLNICM